MTNSPLSCRILVLLVAAIVAWTFVLSLALKFLFGAGVTGGWLIAGLMCTVLFGGLLMMLREIKESLLAPSHVGWESCIPKPSWSLARIAPMAVARPTENLDGSNASMRRQTLGLDARPHNANRRRSGIGKSSPRSKTALAA